jgi:flagellar hook protein FlgE
MDVIGNNVANVNTVAFKSGRVSFKEGFAQLIQGASRGAGDNGGVNPSQVGLGVQIGSLDTLFTQGNIETTGNNTDLAIQGPSFFVVNKGAQRFYTRAGNFSLDASGRLVSPSSGAVVQGRMAVNGVFSQGVTDIELPFGQKVPARATTSVSLAGNLDASAPVFDDGGAGAVDPLDPDQRALPQNARSFKDLAITVYDSQGTQHEIEVVMWKVDVNQWDWVINDADMDITGNVTEVAGTHPFTFLDTGELDTDSFDAPVISFTPAGGAAEVEITLDPGTLADGGITQFAGVANAVIRDQDGYESGTLQSIAIDRTGTILGSFSNGTSLDLAQLVLADFNNPGGLVRSGDNMYTASPNSGAPVTGFVGDGSTSSVVSGALELANVDLAQEFTDMIVAQRGFQANGRVITTSDQMLEELMMLKR